MFFAIKYTYAVTAVLSGLQQRGIICGETEKEMGAISINGINTAYGVGSIKIGAAKDKYVGAAVVFARLYLVTSRNPRRSNKITAFDWQCACLEALKKSDPSANDYEIRSLWDGLVAATDAGEKEAERSLFGFALSERFGHN